LWRQSGWFSRSERWTKKGNQLFEVLTTVTFTEQSSKTKVTVNARATSATAASAPYLEGMEAGWTQSLERLEGFVTKK
jgi:uncharacterized protein YndB with AHSA1/START domain